VFPGQSCLQTAVCLRIRSCFLSTLQATVREHNGKDDDEGKRIGAKECGTDYRLYTVSQGQLIKVTIKSLVKAGFDERDLIVTESHTHTVCVRAQYI
jgi:hypothetical protein